MLLWLNFKLGLFCNWSGQAPGKLWNTRHFCRLLCRPSSKTEMDMRQLSSLLKLDITFSLKTALMKLLFVISVANSIPESSERPAEVLMPRLISSFFHNIHWTYQIRTSWRSRSPQILEYHIVQHIHTCYYLKFYLDEDWMLESPSPWAFYQAPWHEGCWPAWSDRKLFVNHRRFSPCSSHPTWSHWSIGMPHLPHSQF